MVNQKQWKKEYNDGKVTECPYCGQEKLDHSCRVCYVDINKETCWKYGGYCKKCFDFIHNEIPKIEAEKKRLGVKCKCIDPNCAKCLGINCQDKNCPVHTKKRKEDWRRRWEVVHKKSFPHPKNY
jgi:hypothetical protein